MEAASGVAGLISLADLVISKTIKYSLEVKNSKNTISIFLDEATGLLGTLKAIEHTSSLYAANGLGTLSAAQSHIDECYVLLQRIRTALREPELHNGSFKRLRRQLLWPFDSRKTEELVASLERQKQALNLAFSTHNW